MLTERMVEILKAIVDEFVDTAEPVASKTLVDKYRLPYSSATIRNDMALLKKLGYLEQPHTSAGSIPSNKGYQYYCENLLKKDLDDEVKYAISNIFNKQSMNIEDAIKESCRVISDMTSLTSGVLGPDSAEQTLEHIEVIPLNGKTAVCVFITNTGYTENKTFNFTEDVTADDIRNCTNILNDRLKGTPINQLKTKLESIKPILAQSVKRHEMLFNAFVGAFMKFASEKLYFSGTENLYYQPEYADIEKIRDLTKVFNSPDIFRAIANHTSNADTTALTSTGTELVWKDDMAVATTPIKLSPNDNGRIMIVGPKRMEYSRVVSLLDFIQKEIEKLYK